ncbi:hypothetical protein SPHINGO391_90002 [Sphingomonas aurantiaca]|uniref:Uncharacterized protein n=1 Tax=Sphingomonas aurantiaca TaxID=185949 RepID=A0A5E8AMN8_9SPHN|nr:hypothetical protein SPHINGO391_90002 [Sphingomonas aurantiaca]
MARRVPSSFNRSPKQAGPPAAWRRGRIGRGRVRFPLGERALIGQQQLFREGQAFRPLRFGRFAPVVAIGAQIVQLGFKEGDNLPVNRRANRVGNNVNLGDNLTRVLVYGGPHPEQLDRLDPPFPLGVLNGGNPPRPDRFHDRLLGQADVPTGFRRG